MLLRDAILQEFEARTENGALTHSTSGGALVDFFFKSAASRNMKEWDLQSLFDAAYSENPTLALQTLLWLRDVRGGAGERRAFRVLLRHLAERENVETIVRNTPVYGRWDDLLCLLGTPAEEIAVETILKGLLDKNTSGLVAKWMPRQGSEAAVLRRYLQLNERDWRKLIVSLANVVETDMCNKEWDKIDFSKIPSVASARYRAAFNRHQPERYAQWAKDLSEGKAKVNASAVFPHDVLKTVFTDSIEYGKKPSVAELRVLQAQWDSLPNYLGDEFILPVVDVSGSMYTEVSGSTTAMEIAVGLGLYLAMKQKGPFADLFITFSERPEFVALQTKSVYSEMQRMVKSSWGYNTNLQASFELLLAVALKNRISQRNMPDKVLVLSDMEFDSCNSGGTNFDSIRELYKRHGYEMPQLVFWNINSRQANNFPVKHHENGTALVSGYSPSILKSLLKGRISTPLDVVLDTVDTPRYRIF